MKTPSIVTVSLALSLFGFGGFWIHSVAAQQSDPPAAQQPATSEKTADAPPDAPSSPEAMAADKLIEDARSRLEDRQSLQADLFQKLTVLDKTLEAEGKYIAGSPYPKLRLEYRIRVGSMQGSLIEVCDGQILHTEKTVGRVGEKAPDRQFSRRDVQRILAARDNSLNLPVASQGAELGIGGIPALLASIDRCMSGRKVSEEEFDGKLCQVYHGSWDPTVLKAYDAGLAETKARLVPFFPDHVRVYFTADIFLPVKILYMKNSLDEAGKIVGEKVLMSLEFKNVQVDLPVPPETFYYILPPKSEELDRTNEFLELVKQADAAFKNPGAGAKGPATKK